MNLQKSTRRLCTTFALGVVALAGSGCAIPLANGNTAILIPVPVPTRGADHGPGNHDHHRHPPRRPRGR